MSYWPKQKRVLNPLLFIHIPKCAGTSILYWMKSVYGKIYEQGHAPYKDLMHLDLQSFTIIRNPYDRALSFYKHRKEILESNIEYLPHLNTELKAWYNGFDIWLDRHFDTLWEIPSNKRLMYGLTGNGINPIELQYDYINADNRSVDIILKLESINKDFNTITDIVNTPITLPVENVSKGHWVNYRNYYTARSKKLVEKYYEKDLDMFKYRF